MGSLIGKTIVAIKGHPGNISKKIRPEYILLDDGETYLELEDQDPYTYHDHSSSAKEIRLYQNKAVYEGLLALPDANIDL